MLLNRDPSKAGFGCVKCFMFENCWVLIDDCKQVIMNSWRSGSSSTVVGLATQLERCGKALINWDKSSVGNLNVRIKKVEKSFEAALEI